MLLESLITDLKSAKAIIPLLKKQNPQLKEIKVAAAVFQKVNKQLAGERGWSMLNNYKYPITTVFGVWINKE